MALELQELFCHNCNGYVRFNLDLSVDGNYRLDCPKCGHDHYRVVKNGKITDTRWDQSKSQKGTLITGYYFAQSISTTTTNQYLAVSWASSYTSGTTGW